ncbi:MAG TPA: hypothetical protein V6C90_10355 [Coleofasciculaceae cyanobacterium]
MPRYSQSVGGLVISVLTRLHSYSFALEPGVALPVSDWLLVARSTVETRVIESLQKIIASLQTIEAIA